MRLTGVLALLLTVAAFAACSGGGATVGSASPAGGGPPGQSVPVGTGGGAGGPTPAPPSQTPAASPAPTATPAPTPTATPSPTPSPAPTATPPPAAIPTVCPTIIVSMFLIYPKPGSTGIPDAPGQLVIAGYANKVVLQPAAGPPVISTTLVPVPSPLPSPSVSAPGYYAHALAVPTLAPATTYLVTSSEPGACGGTDTATLGSFTTQ